MIMIVFWNHMYFFIGPKNMIYNIDESWMMKLCTISEDDSWNFSDPRTPHSGPVPLSGPRWAWLRWQAAKNSNATRIIIDCLMISSNIQVLQIMTLSLSL